MATKTQIYKEVLREYDALRTRKAAELRERKESLYARFPRLAEIEETLSMVGVSTAKLVLLHPEEREKAIAYHDNIVPLMEAIRYHIDKLELTVDDQIWTLPKYRELLFIR